MRGAAAVSGRVATVGGSACRTAGDCAEGSAGTLAGAIRDGFRAARQIC